MRGKRVGPAQSARGIQLGRIRDGRPAVLAGSPRGTPPPAALAGPGRAHFLRGGAPRPAPGRLGRARGRRWLEASAASFTAPLRPHLVAASRGRGLECSLRPLGGLPVRPVAPPARGGAAAVAGGPPGRGPPPPARLSDRGVLSSVRPDRVASPPGRGPAHVLLRRQGSAAMSATHPTRLVTRTKESNARASQRARSRNPVAQ